MADHTDRTATILHTLPDGTVQHLVLKQVSINAMVVDVSAHVVVSHTFENDTVQATGRAKYVFPVPARAAVCAFTLETSDGKFVIGEVKEKSEAEARYRTALDAGQTAGIVHWAGDDVFTISIGSIRARTSAIAKTTFVMTLMEDSRTDEIRFQLPVSIGAARYGLPLPEAQDAGSPESATRVKFSASIQTSGRLLHITSPSHKNWLSVSFHSTHRGGTPSRHRAVASFASSSFLVDDFVLVIRAEGLDAPRCFAEVDHEHGTIALQLSVIPKFDIPKPATQEYLFLLDRSGSMQNGRIKTAKEALKLLLNILPGEGSYMNIFSFGTECDNGLWPMSHSYNPLNIQTARSHIDRMGADMGGTEITHAVTKVLQSRMTSMSTIVYILTDGSVSQPYVDSTVAIVSNSIQQSLLSDAVSPLRVFTLGIGNEVSTPLCEDVARAGRGIALFAVDSSEIIAKCARLVGAGIHPIVTNISVDWNTSLATGSQSAPVIERVLDIDLQPLPPILQSPLQLPTLYRNHRFVVYAILHTVNMPQSVVLRGTLQNGPTQTIELPVRVRVAKRFSSLAYSSSFLHTLAARGVIRDIREHHYPSQVQTIGIASEAIQRAEIVRLGIRYQLVSAFTSFIGVDTGETVQGMRRAWQRRRDNRQRQRRDSVANGAEGGLWDAAVNVMNSTLAWMFSRTQPVSRSRRMPGGLAPSDASSSTSSRHSVSRTRSSDEGLPYEEGEEGYWTDVTVSTMSSLDSHESIAVFRPARQRWVRTRTRYPEPRKPSPEMHVVPVTPPLVPRPAPRTQDLRLIELQSFDGSFAASSEVMTIMGRDAHAEAGVAAQLGVTEDVWATVLAVDYLERTLQDQPELLDGLMAKMLDFLERQVGLARFEELRARAKGLKM